MTGFSKSQLETFLDLLANGGGHVTLFTTLPTNAENSNGVEVTGNGFARVPVAPAFPSATGNTTTNANGFLQLATNAVLGFPVATGSWGNVVGWGLMSALTGGTCLGAFATTETPVNARYSQSGTTVTVTSVGHGLTTADSIDVRFFNSNGVGNVYPIASAATDTFTFTAPASQTVTNAEIRYGKVRTYAISTNDSVAFSTGNMTISVK